MQSSIVTVRYHVSNELEPTDVVRLLVPAFPYNNMGNFIISWHRQRTCRTNQPDCRHPFPLLYLASRPCPACECLLKLKRDAISLYLLSGVATI